MKLSEKLLKILVENTNLCVRDITVEVDAELNKKYLENCCYPEPNNKSNTAVSCRECWLEFLINDLIKIEDCNPTVYEHNSAGEGMSGHVRREEMSEYTKCQNAVDNNSNKVTVIIDDKEITSSCTISIVTKKYAEIKEIRERVRNGINQDTKRKEKPIIRNKG